MKISMLVSLFIAGLLSFSLLADVGDLPLKDLYKRCEVTAYLGNSDREEYVFTQRISFKTIESLREHGRDLLVDKETADLLTAQIEWQRGKCQVSSLRYAGERFLRMPAAMGSALAMPLALVGDLLFGGPYSYFSGGKYEFIFTKIAANYVIYLNNFRKLGRTLSLDNCNIQGLRSLFVGKVYFSCHDRR